MRREAAVLLGAVGSALLIAIQIILGTADLSSLAPAIETILTAATPLLIGVVTRGVVWSRASVEDLVVRAQSADVIVGAGNTNVLIDLAKTRGYQALEHAVEEAVAIARANLRG